MKENLGRKYLRSPSGRLAGDGIISDCYNETSGSDGGIRHGTVAVKFPNDSIDPARLNGPVVIVQAGKKKKEEDGNG